jgi:hypothetical protein
VSVHIVHVGDTGEHVGCLFALVLAVLGDAVMAQAAYPGCDGGGEGDALVQEVAARGELVGVGTVGRVGEGFDFLHHFGGQGLVVRGQHGHFAQRALSIVSGGLVSVAAAGRGISGSSRGILREHGAVCLAEVGQYAVEVTSCVEAVVHTFCFGDGQMGCSAFGAYGNKILSRAFAVGEV